MYLKNQGVDCSSTRGERLEVSGEKASAVAMGFIDRAERRALEGEIAPMA